MARYALIFFLLASMAAAQQSKVHRLSDVRWPDYDENGKLVSELLGKSAVIREDGLIDITDLTMLLYQDGVLHTRITTPQCVFNKDQMTARSDHDIKLEREEIMLSGKGFSWNAKTGRLEIYDNAKVVFVNMNIKQELEIEE